MLCIWKEESQEENIEAQRLVRESNQQAFYEASLRETLISLTLEIERTA